MDEQIAMLSRTLCADLDTPISLGVYLRMKYGEWDSYLAMRPVPHNYLDNSTGALQYFKDAQAIELLRKYPDLPVRIDRKQVAIDGFYAAEMQCYRTNQRLRPFLENFGLTPLHERIFPFVDDVRKIVRKILGPLPADLRLRFGPGATFESKGHPHASRFTVADKMSMRLALTPGASDLAVYIYQSAWGRAILQANPHMSAPVFTRGNRFTTVDKDATKDRGICIEPGGNVALQLAAGRVLRSRLKRFGIDLNNGQMLHRALARSGSLAGTLATCDLSSASDTVAHGLVKLFLPEEWYDLLSSLRSPMTWMPKSKGKQGGWVRLEKFSSMGNGFTFELETLIFAAITSVASKSLIGTNVFVFGDDIIYPARASADVLAALRYFGFTPNERKSFHDGPFRESCGGDYFAGFSVRPYYLDKTLDKPSDWISAVNGLRRAADQISLDCYRRTRNRALAQLPAFIRRLRGPSALGDLVIHDKPELWQCVVRNSIRYVRVWRPVLSGVRLSVFHPAVQLATALYGSAEGERTNTLQRCLAALEDRPLPEVGYRDATLMPRNAVTGFRTGRVAFS